MAREKQIKPKLFIALDVDDGREAIALAESLQLPGVGFKLGPRLVNRYGADIIHQISDIGPTFVDLKFFDIPNTMLSSVKAVSDAGASFVTVHALCGATALMQLREQEKQIQENKDFHILAVTILTSFDQSNLPTALKGTEISKHVQSLSQDVFNSGINGVVASAQEATAIKNLNPDAFIVTPGVRPTGSAADDQSRITTPQQAQKMGASAIVVGRPILTSQNKRAFTEALLSSFLNE